MQVPQCGTTACQLNGSTDEGWKIEARNVFKVEPARPNKSNKTSAVLHLLQTPALHNFDFTRTSLLIRFDLDAVCGAVRLVARFKSCQFSRCAVAPTKLGFFRPSKNQMKTFVCNPLILPVLFRKKSRNYFCRKIKENYVGFSRGGVLCPN